MRNKYLKDVLDRMSGIEEKQKVLDFILEHDKDEVIIEQVRDWCFTRQEAIYLYNKELKKCELNFFYRYEVLKNEGDEIILKATSLSNFEGYKYGENYYKIDKATNVCMEIPKPAFVIKQKELKTKKAKNANS
jgi:hypothetical protein